MALGGRFFSFGKTETAGAGVETSPASSQTSSAPTTGHPVIDSARANAQAELQASPRRRGRPSKDTISLRADSQALHPDLQAEIQKQIEGALDPRAWAALLALPADTALTITGREHWKISKDERETLGATGSAMARTMMIQSPRLLCAIMLASAMFSCYVPRMSQELTYQREQRLKKKQHDESKPVV